MQLSSSYQWGKWGLEQSFDDVHTVNKWKYKNSNNDDNNNNNKLTCIGHLLCAEYYDIILWYRELKNLHKATQQGMGEQGFEFRSLERENPL